MIKFGDSEVKKVVFKPSASQSYEPKIIKDQNGRVLYAAPQKVSAEIISGDTMMVWAKESLDPAYNYQVYAFYDNQNSFLFRMSFPLCFIEETLAPYADATTGQIDFLDLAREIGLNIQGSNEAMSVDTISYPISNKDSRPADDWSHYVRCDFNGSQYSINVYEAESVNSTEIFSVTIPGDNTMLSIGSSGIKFTPPILNCTSNSSTGLMRKEGFVHYGDTIIFDVSDGTIGVTSDYSLSGYNISVSATMYNLAITKGTGVQSVVVKNGNIVLADGAKVREGTVLTVSATAENGYVLDNYSKTVTVTGNTYINITATADLMLQPPEIVAASILDHSVDGSQEYALYFQVKNPNNVECDAYFTIYLGENYDSVYRSDQFTIAASDTKGYTLELGNSDLGSWGDVGFDIYLVSLGMDQSESTRELYSSLNDITLLAPVVGWGGYSEYYQRDLTINYLNENDFDVRLTVRAYYEGQSSSPFWAQEGADAVVVPANGSAMVRATDPEDGQTPTFAEACFYIGTLQSPYTTDYASNMPPIPDDGSGNEPLPVLLAPTNVSGYIAGPDAVNRYSIVMSVTNKNPVDVTARFSSPSTNGAVLNLSPNTTDQAYISLLSEYTGPQDVSVYFEATDYTNSPSVEVTVSK